MSVRGTWVVAGLFLLMVDHEKLFYAFDRTYITYLRQSILKKKKKLSSKDSIYLYTVGLFVTIRLLTIKQRWGPRKRLKDIYGLTIRWGPLKDDKCPYQRGNSSWLTDSSSVPDPRTRDPSPCTNITCTVLQSLFLFLF